MSIKRSLSLSQTHTHVTRYHPPFFSISSVSSSVNVWKSLPIIFKVVILPPRSSAKVQSMDVCEAVDVNDVLDIRDDIILEIIETLFGSTNDYASTLRTPRNQNLLIIVITL